MDAIKTADFLHLLLTALTLVGWGMLFWSLLVFHQARPEMSTLLTRYYQIEVRQYWLAIVYDKLMILLWFCALISFLCLGVNWYLRKTEKNISWLPQVLLTTVSVVAILVLTIWRPLMG